MRVILPVKPARIDPLAEELLTGLRRPLRSLADGAERERAAAARAWYRNTFLQS